MTSDTKYLNIQDLPWENNESPDSSYQYGNLKNKTLNNEASIYRFTGDKENLMTGKGIFEMQLKLAWIFKTFWHDTIYRPYYMENEKTRTALTSGVFGPKTMELVMTFQKQYMTREFNGQWDPNKGFGSFGENTKDKLEKLYYKVRKIHTKEREKRRAAARNK